MSGNKYHFFEKYGLKIEFYKDSEGNIYSIGFGGYPEYPNGYILGIVSGHTPMLIRHFRYLNFEEEIEIIKNIINQGKPYERYPVVAEVGQICIYKEQTYVYDTLLGGTVIEDETTLDGRNDSKEEQPIIILPSSDMLGILQDYLLWKAWYEINYDSKRKNILL